MPPLTQLITFRKSFHPSFCHFPQEWWIWFHGHCWLKNRSHDWWKARPALKTATSSVLRHPPWCWSQKEDTKVQDQILPSAKSNWVWGQLLPAAWFPTSKPRKARIWAFRAVRSLQGLGFCWVCDVRMWVVLLSGRGVCHLGCPTSVGFSFYLIS